MPNPAQYGAARANQQQHRRFKERRQPCLHREQHDLRGDTESPQRRDNGAVETGGAPLHRRKAVEESVARLDEAAAASTAMNAGSRSKFGRGRDEPSGSCGGDGSAGNIDAASASRIVAATISQIRSRAGMTSAANPAAKLPKMIGKRAPQPHRPIGAPACR